MNPETSAIQPDASGSAPTQLDRIPTIKLNDGNEMPMVRCRALAGLDLLKTPLT